MDDDPEINLLVPIKSVSEEFICPVCFEIIKNCTMTPCSHNFCKDCIDECLNRKKICPCCNAPTNPQQLHPNKQFERVIKILVEEKEKASKEYFDALISGKAVSTTTANSSNSKEQQQQQPSKELSPIEMMFQENLKKSLMTYEDYYQKLKNKTETRSRLIKERYTEMMQQHQKSLGGGKNALRVSQDKRIGLLRSECEAKVQENELVLEQTVQLLQQTFQDHLKNAIPQPHSLPVLVHVSIPCKNVLLRCVSVAQSDNAVQIKQRIAEQMEKVDPVVGFEKANVLVLVNDQGGRVTIMNEAIPVVTHYHLEPGFVLELQGNLKCKSDAPKQCFKQRYVKGGNQKENYYTCRNCSLNWICQTCADSCHKGHTVVDYMLDHEPTWACCYCFKNNKCVLYKKE